MGRGDETLGKKKNISRNVRPKHLARVVRNVDNAIHRINHYPADSVVSDLSGGYYYPAFQQLGPDAYVIWSPPDYKAENNYRGTPGVDEG